MSRALLCVVMVLVAATGIGCASQSVGGSPEAAIAAALQQYRRRAESYSAERRAVVRDREALRQLAEQDAAEVRAAALSRTAVWRVSGDKELLDVYQRVLDASRERGEAVEAIERLREEQRAALDKVDTRVAVRGDKLAAAAKALSALADHRSLGKLVLDYLAFLRASDAELKKLRAAPSPTASEPAAPTTSPPPQ